MEFRFRYSTKENTNLTWSANREICFYRGMAYALTDTLGTVCVGTEKDVKIFLEIRKTAVRWQDEAVLASLLPQLTEY